MASITCVAICGGGGKSTLARKHPTKFVDIDVFVWDEINKEYHGELERAVVAQDTKTIGRLYRKILLSGVEKRFRLCHRPVVLLLHHPEMCGWILGSRCVAVLRPTLRLHRSSIADRTPEMQAVSTNSWERLCDAEEYACFDDLEARMLRLVLQIP